MGLSPKSLPGIELGQYVPEGALTKEMLGRRGISLQVNFQQASECGVGVQRPLDSSFTLSECTRPSGSGCGFGKGRMDLNAIPSPVGHLENGDRRVSVCLSGSISRVPKAGWGEERTWYTVTL